MIKLKIGILVLNGCKTHDWYIRPLAKLASDRQVRGAYGTKDRSVLNIHEGLSAEATKQLAAEGEFCKRSIFVNTLPF